MFIQETQLDRLGDRVIGIEPRRETDNLIGVDECGRDLGFTKLAADIEERVKDALNLNWGPTDRRPSSYSQSRNRWVIEEVKGLS